jgi:hypothetical protein
MYYDDEEPNHSWSDDSAILSKRYPTAARDHQCDSCAGVIQKGQTYTKVAQLAWGSFEMRKYHRHEEECDR